MTVRKRLGLTMLGISVLLVVPSLYSLTRLNAVQEITEEIQGKNAAAILALGRLQTAIAELDRSLRSYVAAPDPELRSQVEERLSRSRNHIAALRQVGFVEPADRADERVDSLVLSVDRIAALVEAGLTQEATATLEQVKPLLALAQDSLAQVASAIDQRSEQDVARAQMISATAATTVLLGIVGAVAAALLLGFWTTRALTTPLLRLRAATARVSAGAYEVPEALPYERRDEIGDLSRSFRAMAVQLAELDRLKAEFLSMASHDLKTPINVIGGYAELLETGIYGELSEKQRDVLRTVKQQTTQLTNQVNQLLNASRMEAGGFRVALEDVVVADLLNEVERGFAALADQKSIDFRVGLEDGAPSVITGDADRLRNEVLGNLLSNAFKFTPEGGRVEVRAGAEDAGTFRIAVSDTGKGIPPEEIPHIFDKFYQVGQAERRIGSGLGLAIALQVVEAHNGRIDVESEPGSGATFIVRIPSQQPRGQHRTEALFASDGKETARAGEPAEPASSGA